MIRVVIYLVIVGLLALAAAWLADRPGEVAITWQGWAAMNSFAASVVTPMSRESVNAVFP